MTKTVKRPSTPRRPRRSVPFHYTAVGLDNVWLMDGFEIEETPYGAGVRIEDADGLHDAIAHGIVTRRAPIAGPELRFLRKHINLSQAGLARMLGSSEQSVARWEKRKEPMDPAAERLVRFLVTETLGRDVIVQAALKELAEMDTATHGERRLSRQSDGWKEAA